MSVLFPEDGDPRRSVILKTAEFNTSSAYKVASGITGISSGVRKSD
jgi:hypothetical protein